MAYEGRFLPRDLRPDWVSLSILWAGSVVWLPTEEKPLPLAVGLTLTACLAPLAYWLLDKGNSSCGWSRAWLVVLVTGHTLARGLIKSLWVRQDNLLWIGLHVFVFLIVTPIACMVVEMFAQFVQRLVPRRR